MHDDDIEAGIGVVPRAVSLTPLSPSKSFTKLRFGKDNLFQRSKSLDSSLVSQRIINYREDEDEDTTWQIGSKGSSLAARTDRFDDLVIISTIGAFDGTLGYFARLYLVLPD